MAQKISDLSDLLSDDKHVRFRPGGPVYTLPGDIPAELFLEIQLEAERESELIDSGETPDAGHAIVALRERLLELFRYRDPDMDKLPAEVTLPQLLRIVPRLYGGEEPQEATSEARPSKAGTRSTTRSGRSKSRS
jgi:hypothetical protein